MEDRQVVQAGSRLRMLRTEVLLADAKGVPVQGLCLSVHCVFKKVSACSVKEIRRLRQQEVMVLDQRIARLDLFQVAQEIARRLAGTFLRDASGRRPVYGGTEKFQTDPLWKDYLLSTNTFTATKARDSEQVIKPDDRPCRGTD